MKIKYRILLGFTLIYIISFYFLIFWTVTEVNTQPKKAMEESLVDISHILASYLEQGLEGEHIHTNQLKTVLNAANRREFSAQIYELRKERIGLRVLVVDIYGQVIFDSENDEEVGKDYSNWNDIRNTFDGGYGVRTTKTDPDDPGSSVAYVAAPIYQGEKIVGVCTVAKPWRSIHSFTRTTQKKFSLAGILGFFLILILSYLISSWITNPIIKLTNYANAVKEEKRVSQPLLGKGEMRTLAIAFERMRESLEGKEYIEKYVQNLTHQLKGPLSSIRGAAELLQEDLPETDRKKFIRNIEKENARIQRIVDRLLELASLEKRRGLQQVEKTNLTGIVEDVIESLSPIMDRRNIICHFKIKKPFHFLGERFLMIQAISNLIQNAIDFSPPKGEIVVNIRSVKNQIQLSVSDQGTGIPGYALPQVFDKFYSLPRPHSGQKSSGLGLSMVKEVVQLHGGKISLKNNQEKGVTATLSLQSLD